MSSLEAREVQEEDTQGIDGTSQKEQNEGNVLEPGESKPKKRRVRKDPQAAVFVREPGKSLLPFSRVQKIIKADKDIPIIAKDATFLISLATEEFIKRLCEAGKLVAEREKRATVQHKDIATVVRKADEFLFLEEIIPWLASDPPTRRRKNKDPEMKEKPPPTLLDQFVVRTGKDEGVDDQGDVVMNEDGTMAVEMDELYP